MGMHRCAADGCSKQVKEEMLMCAMHWRRVPQQIKMAIWNHYKRGQDISTVSEDYMKAYHAAVASV